MVVVGDGGDRRGKRGTERGHLWRSKRTAVVSGAGREGDIVREERLVREKRSQARGLASVHEQQLARSVQSRVGDVSVVRDNRHVWKHCVAAPLRRRKRHDG